MCASTTSQTRRRLQAQKQERLSEILSEGEHRVVAIAGFFAEVAGAPAKSPIVFDDPVSSLDHIYRRAIAQRIVEEVKQRQVIIFTHDIAFLVEIEKQCAGIPLTVQTVKRVGDTPGRCMDGVPWEAMKLKDQLTYIDNHVSDIASLHGSDQQVYDKEAGYEYGLLREAWEAFIERDLLYETVKRHDTDVQTQRLMQVEIRDEDCPIIDAGMSKCSTWMTGHAKSEALSIHRPSPTELREDIQSLRDFARDVNKRREGVRARRKKLLEAQVSELG